MKKIILKYLLYIGKLKFSRAYFILVCITVFLCGDKNICCCTNIFPQIYFNNEEVITVECYNYDNMP